MQQKVLLWFTAVAVALGSMAGLAVQTARAEVIVLPIVISAVQISGGEGAANHDFVELYNPNPYPIDLNGYRLVKRSALGTADSSIKSFSSQTLIPAYSFYLWANSGWTEIGVNPDTTTSATMAADNGVGLRKGALDTGELIDSLAWGQTDNGFASTGLSNPAGGQSIVRQDLYENLGYELSGSNPRNSGIQAIPDNIPDLIQNAQCLLESGSVLATAGQTVLLNLKLLNQGTTVWDSTSYHLQQTGPDGVFEINLNDNVNPQAEITVAISLIAPEQSNEYIYQWQMSADTGQFGEICTITLRVKDEEPDEKPQPMVSTIRITELLPNPVGDDNGYEVVELHNYGNAIVNLENWVLDDVSGTLVSSNAFTLGPQTLGAGQYLAVTIPAGKFGLNNSGGDVLSLFSRPGELVSTLSYSSTAPEGKSYSLVDGSWHWTLPSLGVVNPALPTEKPNDPKDDEPQDEPNPDPEPTVYQLKISELYPAPNPGQTEFIEIYNGSEVSVNLSGYKIVIGSRSQTLPDVLVESRSFYAFTANDLKLPLANGGKLVQLQTQDGELIDEVTYPKARNNQSYSWFEDSYLWTQAITPGAENQLVVSEINSDKASKKSVKAVNKSAVKSPNISSEQSKIVDAPSLEQTRPPVPTTKPKPDFLSALAIGIASLSAGVYAIYKFGISGL